MTDTEATVQIPSPKRLEVMLLALTAACEIRSRTTLEGDGDAAVVINAILCALAELNPRSAGV